MVRERLSSQELALIDLLVGVDTIFSNTRLAVELQFSRQSIKWIQQVGISVLKAVPIAEQPDVIAVYLDKPEYLRYLGMCCSHFGFTVNVDGSTFTQDNQLVIDSNNNRIY